MSSATNSYRRTRTFVALGATLVVLAVVSASLGSYPISWSVVGAQLGLTGGGTASVDPRDPTLSILLHIRLPRVALAMCVGAALATAGVAFQAVFRNPLADPFVIGASSGAGLGATVAIAFFGGSAGVSIPLCAFLGSLLATLLAYVGAAVAGDVGRVTLLLSGAAVSGFLGSVAWLVMYMRTAALPEIVAWTMGSLAGRGWDTVALTALGLAVVVTLLWCLSRPLDALSLGDDVASSLGLPVFAIACVTVVLGSVLTAAAVASAGIIGFIGLIAPHVARTLVGPALRHVVPAAALTGASLLLLSDTLARTLLSPSELPVGIVSALAGGPLFFWMIRHQFAGPTQR